jgi:CheY-like chemotaxis protein
MRSLLAGRVDRVVEAPTAKRHSPGSATNCPAVVFLDLMLPKLDGAGVLSAMKKDPTLRDVPVVIVTWTDIELRGGRTAVGPAAGILPSRR